MTAMDILNEVAEESYPFKRRMFYKLKDFIDKHPLNIAYVTGPRRCGKTVVLKQLREAYSDRAIYVNFKEGSDESILLEILQDAKEGKDTIYLLDEITSLDYFDTELMTLDTMLGKVKVILTGSQSHMLDMVCGINYATKAKKYSMGFLTFSEYLEYKGKTLLKDSNFVPTVERAGELMRDITADDYIDFIIQQYSFRDVIEDGNRYVRDCISESVISNRKAKRDRYSVVKSEISTEMILKVAYAILFKLHNNVDRGGLFEGTSLNLALKAYKKKDRTFPIAYALEQVKETLKLYYQETTRMSTLELTQSIRFLLECDMIVVSIKYDSEEPSRFTERYFLSEIYNGRLCDMTADEILTEYDITFKYPLFIVTILFDLIDKIPDIRDINKRDFIFGSFLGSLLECEIKGYFSEFYGTNYLYKLYRRSEMKEVDFYNISSRIAVEITCSNKSLQDVHFSTFREYDSLRKILLTKDINDEIQGIRRIPYYIFAYTLSDIL